MNESLAPHLVLGRRGEEIAVQYLQDREWQVLDRNWRCPEGEIDIVAIDPSGKRPVLVVVEVKTRAGTGFGSGAQAVTIVKYRRLRRLAARWLAAHRLPRIEVRLDVVSVLLAAGDKPRLEHVAGAFR